MRTYGTRALEWRAFSTHVLSLRDKSLLLLRGGVSMPDMRLVRDKRALRPSSLPPCQGRSMGRNRSFPKIYSCRRYEKWRRGQVRATCVPTARGCLMVGLFLPTFCPSGTNACFFIRGDVCMSVMRLVRDKRALRPFGRPLCRPVRDDRWVETGLSP